MSNRQRTDAKEQFGETHKDARDGQIADAPAIWQRDVYKRQIYSIGVFIFAIGFERIPMARRRPQSGGLAWVCSRPSAD